MSTLILNLWLKGSQPVFELCGYSGCLETHRKSKQLKQLQALQQIIGDPVDKPLVLER